MPANVDWNEIGTLVAAGGQLVDVMPYKEFEQAHLPDALNIPLKQLDGKTTKVLRRDRPVIVYCYDRQ
jgi:rhodanese-related sulfurtransferase